MADTSKPVGKTGRPICKICGVLCDNLKSYIQHCRIHRYQHNVRFPCVYLHCLKTCSTYKGLLTHIKRSHDAKENPRDSHKSYINAGIMIQCTVQICQKKCADVQELLSHLRNHIADGLPVPCPFQNCEKKFNKKKSFSSHLSRCHRNYTACTVKPAFVLQEDQLRHRPEINDYDAEQGSSGNGSEDWPYIPEGSVDCLEEVESRENIAEYTRSIALFLMRLLAKYLVPESTIQIIAEELYSLFSLSRECVATHVQKVLQSASVADEGLGGNILDGIAELGCCLAPAEDAHKFHSPQCGTLRSTFLRKNYYKNEFSYVSPVEIHLGQDSAGRTHVFHYVPILETLQVLCRDKSVQKNFVQPSSSGKVYRDIHDGETFQQSAFYKENPQALQIILYQDSFEVVNPLGSARNKHKILAVYYTLGNINARCRSQIDQMQLVLLCKEKTIREFGHEDVFSKLVEDLKYLEQKGICVGDEVKKGTILAIVGDNLGSHFIGGFCESFNSQNFCRYCLRTKKEIEEEPPFKEGEYRTPDSYSQSLHVLQEGQVNLHSGIKFDSMFNSLTHFHVAAPGLPPCLGHDLFEGIVDFDLALFIHYFVDCGWFTFDLLNEAMTKFPFCTNDLKDVLRSVKKGEKIGGQAVENWYFLRLFPLVVFCYVQDVHDPVWELVLKLKSIVEIVVAPSVHQSQVAYLKVLVDEYLDERQRLFPQKKLRPKHHFLSHYPWLILKFGPLIRVWTLRFESKHTFFKRCVRYSSNFKNVTATLSERHQLLQAYACEGQLFPECLKTHRGTVFDPVLCTSSIQNAVRRSLVQHTFAQAFDEVSVFGTVYRKGMYVVTSLGDTGTWTFARILLILISGEAVYFVAKKCISTYHCGYGLYEVQSSSIDSAVVCIAYEDLADYFPLAAYSVKGYCMISLKNMPVSN